MRRIHGYTDEHYVYANARPLGRLARKALFSSALALRDKYEIKETDDFIKNWIDANFWTHYLNFYEYWLNEDIEYTPGLTRSNLKFLRTDITGGTEIHRFVTASIAYLIIKKTKHRKDLIDVALNWCESNEGQKILKNYEDLMNLRISSSPAKKKEIDDLVRSINDANHGFLLQNVLDVVTIGEGFLLKDTKSISETIGKIKNRLATIKKPLRWLWDLRGQDSKIRFQNEVKRLLNS